MGVHDTFFQHGRALEWATSSVLFVFALVLAVPGDSLMTYASYVFFPRIGITESLLVVALSSVSVMRFVGLWINGNWKRSPKVREWGATFGAVMFLSLSMMIAIPYFQGQVAAMSVATGVFFVLGVFDILAAYRSASDANCYK